LEVVIADDSNEIEDYRSIERGLSEKIVKQKSMDEILLEKMVLDRKIKEYENNIATNDKKQIQLLNEIQASKARIDALEAEYMKDLQSSRIQCNKALANIKQRFAAFVSIATKGDYTATLTDQLVPVFEGRQIFDPALVAQSEKAIMDYAFRIALLSTCAEGSNTFPSIVLETPDEIIDGSYLHSLAQALQQFSKNLSVIITTFNPEIIDLMLVGYELKGKDRRRLTSLLINGTTTQKNYFESKLLKYT
jgi:hypothetical protein